MSEQNQNGNGGADAASLVLARHIRDLDAEMVPSRSLWPGIERRIAEFPQEKKRSWHGNWMPYGVAASLLVAVSALLMNVYLLNQTGELPMVTSTTSGQALETMQVEYLKVRNPLIDQFTETNKNLAPETLEELYRNIEIMERARRDIEAQVRKEPGNRRLVELLMRIHEQELELLKQDFSQPTRSM